MFGSLFVAAVLCAQGDVKLAAPGFSKSGLSQEQATFFSGHLAARLSATPWLKVVSSEDIAQIIGLERQKELLGCADGKASCMAELAGALGVDGMVVGQVAKVGQSFQVNVKVMDPAGNPLFVHSSERLGTEEAMLDELNRIAGLIADKLEPMHDKRAPAGSLEVKHAEAKPTYWPALGVAGAGVVVLAGAALCWVNVSQEWGSLQRATSGTGTTADVAMHIRDSGKNWQLAGGILSAVGGAALVGGLLWYFLHSEPPATVALSLDGHGAGAAVRFTW